MTIGLDTSVVVRLLVGEPAPQSEAALRLLEDRARGGEMPAAVSDLVVGETYFALRHHYRVPHEGAVAALRALLSDPRIVATGTAGAVLQRLGEAEGPPGLMDRLIHADYDRSGAVLLTFDRDAARQEGVRLLAS